MEGIEKTVIVIGTTYTTNIENYESEGPGNKGKIIEKIKIENKNDVRN